MSFNSFASLQIGNEPEEGNAPSYRAPSDNLVPSGERQVQVRAGNSVVSYNEANLETTQSGVSTLNTIDLSNGASGLLGTAKTPTGSPRAAGELRPTDIVTFQGRTMPLSSAEYLGLVSRDANGRYVEQPLVNGQPQGVEAAPAEATDQGEAFSSPQAEGELADLCQAVTGTTQVAVLSSLVEAGEVNPGTLARAASEAGVSLEEMTGRINSVAQAFQAQAEATIKGLGADNPDDFFEWAAEHKPRALKEAMRQQGMERTTKGYSSLYADYVQSIGDADPQAILSAKFGGGITAHQEGNKVLLTIPGVGQVDYRVAVKQGLVKVSGA